MKDGRSKAYTRITSAVSSPTPRKESSSFLSASVESFSIAPSYERYHEVRAFMVSAFLLANPQDLILFIRISASNESIDSADNSSWNKAVVFLTLLHDVFCTNTDWNITVYGSSDHQAFRKRKATIHISLQRLAFPFLILS